MEIKFVKNWHSFGIERHKTTAKESSSGKLFPAASSNMFANLEEQHRLFHITNS
jgi:hypothetical protein